MAIAVVILLLVIATLVFHFISPLYGWWFTDIASNWGMIDTTINITFVVTGIVFVAVNFFLVYCVIKFRHTEGRKADYDPENKKLETWLTVVTSIGVAAMLAPGLRQKIVRDNAAALYRIGNGESADLFCQLNNFFCRTDRPDCIRGTIERHNLRPG